LVQVPQGSGAFMDLKQWVQFLPMYSGSMWETIAFSTVSTSPTTMSRLAIANLRAYSHCNAIFCF
jgi:hypothetical protein